MNPERDRPKLRGVDAFPTEMNGRPVICLRDPTGLSEQVACVPGSAFGPTGEGYLRCCFATALERIEIAVERMARFVARLA